MTDPLAAVRLRHYPEAGAAGFSRTDGTVAFFSRVHALLGPTDRVLDLGAGRGSEHLDDPVPFRRRLRDLRGEGRHVIGVDVDEAVLGNRFVDEAHVVTADRPLPLDDASIDLILSDYVLEHIADPVFLVGEVSRVLRPGGWFCARTPNLFSYAGLGTHLIPNRLHVGLLNRLQPGRKAMDVFPTAYRINSFAALRRHFPRDSWHDCSYATDAEPVYVGGFSPAWSLMRLVQALTPRSFRTNLFVFLQKRGD